MEVTPAARAPGTPHPARCTTRLLFISVGLTRAQLKSCQEKPQSGLSREGV